MTMSLNMTCQEYQEGLVMVLDLNKKDDTKGLTSGYILQYTKEPVNGKKLTV